MLQHGQVHGAGYLPADYTPASGRNLIAHSVPQQQSSQKSVSMQVLLPVSQHSLDSKYHMLSFCRVNMV